MHESSTHRISLEEVTHSYNMGGSEKQRVLSDINCRFRGGETAVIRGRTGAGKSTLLHILCGILRPTSGIVVADEEKVSKMTAPNRDFWRRRAGILLQSPHLLEDMSVFDNVVLPLVPHRVLPREGIAKVTKALESTGMKGAGNLRPRALSGGERQRVALARAIVHEPVYLFLDEPTAHQDEQGIGLVYKCIEESMNRGAVVVAASHDPRFAPADSVRFDLDSKGLFRADK